MSGSEKEMTVLDRSGRRPEHHLDRFAIVPDLFEIMLSAGELFFREVGDGIRHTVAIERAQDGLERGSFRSGHLPAEREIQRSLIGALIAGIERVDRVNSQAVKLPGLRFCTGQGMTG